MSQPRLPDPSPRAVPTPYFPVQWHAVDEIRLEPGVAPLQVDLAGVLASRRSASAFELLSVQALGGLLWYVARTLALAPSPYGFELQHRPVPSAGAIHPIHVVLQIPGRDKWARYDARTHRLAVLGNSADVLHHLRAEAARIVDPGRGTLVAFVAEPGLTAAKYENPESLLWRDAGVLQGAISLVAEAVGLNLCLLGATGNPWVGRLAEEGKLTGVGLGILGARA